MSVSLLILCVCLINIHLVFSQVTSFFCPTFDVTNSMDATQNYILCTIPNVCPGVKLSISGCSSYCQGDQYVRLYDQNGVEVFDNDDGNCESPLQSCSDFTYVSNVQSCQTFTLRQGCYGADQCSGKMKVFYRYTPAPTVVPSVLPTVNPTLLPTVSPSTSSLDGTSCPSFTVSSTNNANVNTADCFINICPNTILTVSDCDGTCSGDQFVRLFDATNNLITFDDDGCSTDPYALCSRFTHTYLGPSCQVLKLKQGCWGTSQCSGTMSISKVPYIPPTASPTHAPTNIPTTAFPTVDPSAFPTAAPSVDPSTEPTFIPTVEPSSGRPSYWPTKAPRINPSPSPTKAPRPNPTKTPTKAPVIDTRSNIPTRAPVIPPTLAPTNAPVFTPTAPPSKAPRPAPTRMPTDPGLII